MCRPNSTASPPQLTTAARSLGRRQIWMQAFITSPFPSRVHPRNLHLSLGLSSWTPSSTYLRRYGDASSYWFRFDRLVAEDNSPPVLPTSGGRSSLAEISCAAVFFAVLLHILSAWVFFWASGSHICIYWTIWCDGQMEKAVAQPCILCNYCAWPTGFRASTVQGLPCRTGPTVHFRAWPYHCSHDTGVNVHSRSPKIVHDRPRKSFLAIKIDNITWGIASLANH